MGDEVSEFPDGVDPRHGPGLILLLTDDESEGGWRPMTPFDGVLPLPADGGLPFEVSERYVVRVTAIRQRHPPFTLTEEAT